MWLLTRAGMDKLADGLIADIAAGNFTGLLTDTFLHLAKDAPAFDLDMVKADFAAANFTGYAPKALVFDNPYKAANGKTTIGAAEVVFRPTDGVTPNTIRAKLLCDDVGGTTLLAVEYLDNPVELVNADNEYTVAVHIQIPLDQGWGSSTDIA